MEIKIKKQSESKLIADKIQDWLKDYLDRSGCKGFVLGLSGGLDSSVTGVLCRRVTDATLGLILPCGFTLPESKTDAKLLAKQFDIQTKTYDLTPAYDMFLEILGLSKSTPVTIPLANLKARLRMLILYYVANKHNYLVVGTGNRTEIALGYFTKYGDAGVDILPIGGLLKREVRRLASHLGVPKRIIDKIPTPGLWLDQTDEGELGASYDQLDQIVAGDIPDELSENQITQIRQRIAINEHKRRQPPICPV